MSDQRRIAWGVAAVYLGRMVQIIFGLVVIPVLYQCLNPAEVGIWFILSQSAAFVALLDFGFGPTLIRQYAFARGVAIVADQNDCLTATSLSNLVATGRMMYRCIAVISLLVALPSGYLLFAGIDVGEVPFQTILIAWTITCVGYSLGVWGNHWTCLMTGLGHVGAAGGILVGCQSMSLLVKIFVLLRGGGLIELAIVEFATQLSIRVVAQVCLRSWEPTALINGTTSWSEIQTMANPALKCWLMTLGSFLILRTDQYFIAIGPGVAALPDYHSTYQLFANLYVLALALSNTSSTFCSQRWAAGDRDGVIALLSSGLHVGLSTVLCGVIAIISSSPDLHNLWLGPGHFIGFPLLFVFAILMVLEVQHVCYATVNRSTGDEAFATISLLAGGLNLIFTGVLIQFFGLLGVAMATLLAQMLTNNWYTIVRAHRRLKLPLGYHFRNILPGITVLGLGCAGPLGLLRLTTDPAPMLWVAGCMVWCGSCLIAYWHWQPQLWPANRWRNRSKQSNPPKQNVPSAIKASA